MQNTSPLVVSCPSQHPAHRRAPSPSRRCIQATSAVTYQVSAQVKNAAIIVAGFVLFDYPIYPKVSAGADPPSPKQWKPLGRIRADPGLTGGCGVDAQNVVGILVALSGAAAYILTKVKEQRELESTHRPARALPVVYEDSRANTVDFFTPNGGSGRNSSAPARFM